MQRHWPAKGTRVTIVSWGNRQSRVTPPWVSKTQRIKCRVEDTAQWLGVFLTHARLWFDAQYLKEKEVEFNLRANSYVVGGEREKNGICSSSKLQ